MTPENDHDLLVRIDTRVTELKDQVSRFNQSSAEDRRQLHEIKADKSDVHDHETRLRRQERFLYIGIGGLMTLQLIFGLFELLKK
jgi:hypothetical protein